METRVAAFIMAHIAITINKHFSVRLVSAQQRGTFRLKEEIMDIKLMKAYSQILYV